MIEIRFGCCLNVRSHSEVHVAPRISTVSEHWITESSNLTDVRPGTLFKGCGVQKRMTSDLVGLSVMVTRQNRERQS